jgi:hypothetical protein
VKKHQVFGWTLVAMDIAAANFGRWSCGLEADKDSARLPQAAPAAQGRVRRSAACRDHSNNTGIRASPEAELQSVRALASPMMQMIDIVTANTHKRLIIEWSPELRGVIDRGVRHLVPRAIIRDLQSTG